MQWMIKYPSILASSIGIAIFFGVIVGWFVKQKMQFKIELLEKNFSNNEQFYSSQLEQAEKKLIQTQHELISERDKFSYELKKNHGKLMAMNEKLNHFEIFKQESKKYADELNHTKKQKHQLEVELKTQEIHYKQQNKANLEKLQFLEKSEERLKQQFEYLANKLFETKTAKIEKKNEQNLTSILLPFKEQLIEFKTQINNTLNQEAKERHTLVHELKNLQRLNEKMACEAVNLTQALKGDNKQQGNWGEVVLARVLTESGLREGHEYKIQVNLKNEFGKTYQPDVIVYLPKNRQVIIDSKMALTAFERYFNSSSAQEKKNALKDHLSTLRTHIKGLSSKDYHKLKEIKSLDYVLMFIPVEPAFQIAVQSDPGLLKNALEQNIILSSPTTLLVALRTIDNLWKNERQNQNTQIIAERASKLYDKVRLFIDDMEDLGRILDKSQQNYQAAINKLTCGKGNIIRQIESFRKLGVKIKRPISIHLSKIALSEDENFMQK
ncbi:DNA recombination protein rmuC [Candidatus Photodesmus katoptron]|uniref:RmuC n=1 Tax=Candidatus Photodesmus katoptron Akat1 TaxID=1236703 RepID=S3E1F3_9GAMM|nr:DNA recombination protein RmuC [Candidatus Photodesmus katoptron]EPE38011.1 rmuC [Candidatus Photodesmus katoptron Akat1]KEY90751.1 DNA recombination protein rmuC [Candidatus Photodesmus katoptron]